MEPIIKIESLSKQYRLGVVGTGTLSHDLNRWWNLIRGKEDPYLKIGDQNDRTKRGQSDYVWALKDINLEVAEGEVLGIIGRNGAGKSTLLKILSKVTGPTTGKISYKGRIASLLEVGTGFHPELTGRENIYINGAILGMRKNEIDHKFDSIVDFSGCEKYIDTPVKRYSSGMTVRLGFAVAAFLDPEILVVDEVLAVGDAEFQKKALGKMQEVSQMYGRTVLFVSHNMAAIKSLCNKGIILNNGLIFYNGEIDSCVSIYLKGESDLINYKKGSNNLELKLTDIEILEIYVKAKYKNFNDVIGVNDEIECVTKYRKLNSGKRIDITMHFKDEQGAKIFSTSSVILEDLIESGEGLYLMGFTVPKNFLNWGTFFIDLYIVENMKKALKVIPDILSFTISNNEIKFGRWMGKEPGSITPNFLWDQKKIE